MTSLPITALAALALFPALAMAQWPDYRNARTPRLPDGKPDLRAPALRTPDGKPDLSGVWDRGMPVLPPGAKTAAAGPPIAGFGAPQPAGPRPFQDLPSMFPNVGLPMLPWAAELRRERKEQNSKDHPDAHCLPLNPVQLHAHPQPRKIIQSPNLILILYEANNGIRQIFMDGRKLPTDDPQPWWYGYSVGHWDGDTLVTQTTGFRDMGWIDEEGTPITSTGKVTERFRRVNFGTLEIEITIDDPKTFTRPWSYKLTQNLMPDTELIEFVCQENNRSVPHLVGK